MDCVKCGAPLPARTSRCAFCGALNDVDLRALHARYESTGQTEHACPRCHTPMSAIQIELAGGMTVERCDTCLGLFFDPGEADAVLDIARKPLAHADFKRLQQITEQETPEGDRGAMYIKCPVCRKLMNRDSFGARSGVVVDRCADHGVWMDGGELGQLLKWMSAGGKLLADARERDEQRAAEIKKRVARATRINQAGIPTSGPGAGGYSPDGGISLPYLIGTFIGFLTR